MSWKEELTNEINKKTKNEKINFKQEKKLFIWWEIFLFICLSLFIIVPNVASSIDESQNFRNSKIIIIISIIIVLFFLVLDFILLIFSLKKRKIKKRIIKKINSEINLYLYYEKAIQEKINDQVKVVNINDEFNTWLLQLQSYAYKDCVSQSVLNLSGAKYELSIGTITERKIYLNRAIYYRRFVLTGLYKNNFNLIAKIQLRKQINKVYDKSNVFLEYPEFNSTFNITTDNQLAIRKILTPKVIEKLLNLKRKIKKKEKPTIFFEKNKIAIVYQPFGTVADFKDLKKLIGKIQINRPWKSVPEQYIANIERDLKVVNSFFYWLNALEIS